MTLTSRSYSVQYSIAKNALLSLKKLNDPKVEKLCKECILFTPQQLRMICYDNAFATLENFLDHIGFILFDDWGSEKGQKHYSDKLTKLLTFDKFTEARHQTDLLQETLVIEWHTIIQSVSFDSFNKKRNPIKHTHAGKHDSKVIAIESGSMISSEEMHYKLTEDTFLALTNNECEDFVKYFEDIIASVHNFLSKYKLRLDIYCNGRSEQFQERWDLLDAFLHSPFTITMYVGETSLV